jgi:hypothetical protein
MSPRCLNEHLILGVIINRAAVAIIVRGGVFRAHVLRSQMSL